VHQRDIEDRQHRAHLEFTEVRHDKRLADLIRDHDRKGQEQPVPATFAHVDFIHAN